MPKLQYFSKIFISVKLSGKIFAFYLICDIIIKLLFACYYFYKNKKVINMSIRPISSGDSSIGLQKKLQIASGVGLVAGTAGVAARKNWLFKGMPSDKFVKTVSKNLEKTMTSDELKESSRINKFLKSVVDPEVDMETLKPQIRDSKELSAAIKSTPDETIENAITRVFSNPDKNAVKQELLDLQYKTASDKKADNNTALKLIHDNFDAKEKKLVKSPNTADNMFAIVKKSARKIQAKAAVTGGILTGIAAGAICLITSDIPDGRK